MNIKAPYVHEGHQFVNLLKDLVIKVVSNRATPITLMSVMYRVC